MKRLFSVLIKDFGYGAAVLSVVVGIAAPVQGGVIRVAKDGSAPYSVIQDAVNAASPGDTILIGPGRYDETSSYYLIDSFTAETCVGVEIENISLIGESGEDVIIGPAAPNFSSGGPHGILSQIGIQKFRIESLTVENVYYGALVFGSTEIKNVAIRNCEDGVYGETEIGLTINNCRISQCRFGLVAHYPSRNISLVNSRFVSNRVCAALVGVENVNISYSGFKGERGGVQFELGSTGRIFGCEFSEFSHFNVAALESVMEISDNSFGHSGYGSIFRGEPTVVTGSGNVFAAGLLSALRLEEGADVSLSGNHIFFDEGHSVWIRGGIGYEGDDVFLGFENNYWGTTNVDSIAASIFDGNDEPTYKAFVDFLPIADAPLPSKKQNFGSLKAMFR